MIQTFFSPKLQLVCLYCCLLRGSDGRVSLAELQKFTNHSLWRIQGVIRETNPPTSHLEQETKRKKKVITGIFARISHPLIQILAYEDTVEKAVLLHSILLFHH